MKLLQLLVLCLFSSEIVESHFVDSNALLGGEILASREGNAFQWASIDDVELIFKMHRHTQDTASFLYSFKIKGKEFVNIATDDRQAKIMFSNMDLWRQAQKLQKDNKEAKLYIKLYKNGSFVVAPESNYPGLK